MMTNNSLSQRGHLFISHSSANRNIVEELKRAFESLAVPTWDSATNIDGGSDWIKEVTTNLRTSAGVIVLLTDESVKSAEVKREVKMAQDFGIPLIPVNLTNNYQASKDFPDGWHYILATLQLMSYQSSYETAIRICTALGIQAKGAMEDIKIDTEPVHIPIRMKITLEPIFRLISRIDLTALSRVLSSIRSKVKIDLGGSQKKLSMAVGGVVAISLVIFLFVNQANSPLTTSANQAPQASPVEAENLNSGLAGTWQSLNYKAGKARSFLISIVSKNENSYVATFYQKSGKVDVKVGEAKLIVVADDQLTFEGTNGSKRSAIYIKPSSQININNCSGLIPNLSKVGDCQFFKK